MCCCRWKLRTLPPSGSGCSGAFYLYIGYLYLEVHFKARICWTSVVASPGRQPPSFATFPWGFGGQSLSWTLSAKQLLFLCAVLWWASMWGGGTRRCWCTYAQKLPVTRQIALSASHVTADRSQPASQEYGLHVHPSKPACESARLLSSSTDSSGAYAYRNAAQRV